MKDKRDLLLTYINANIASILVDFINAKDIDGAILLPAGVSNSLLNGHYEGEDFIPPKWLNEILSTNKTSVLIIDKIDTISKEEQMKFYELLKYKKISTFELPKDTVIIITAEEINEEKINEEIFSLVVRI